MVIFERGGLLVADAEQGPLGGPELEFRAARDGGTPTLDAAVIAELRDELTEWLRRRGRE